MLPVRLSSPYSLILCRPGAEPELAEELQRLYGLNCRREPGFCVLEGAGIPAEALIFERQRLPAARYLALKAGERLNEEVLDELWKGWDEDPQPWAIQAYGPEEGEGSQSKRLGGLEKELLRGGEKRIKGLKNWQRKAEKLLPKRKGKLLQVFLQGKGVWFSWAPCNELTSVVEGGRCRMRMDAAAPSRSYLKMEEALFRMEYEPQEEETVIDLGAAPGGWSFAFAKRGCRVTAIDNGPLKIQDACVRRIEHLHLDGLSFRLARHMPPVDWLVGDMLIPPGKALSVLRYWLGEHKCRNLVFNVKLPQQEPMPALEPLLEYLEQEAPELEVRQLYHDRREVTIFGSRVS